MLCRNADVNKLSLLTEKGIKKLLTIFDQTHCLTPVNLRQNCAIQKKTNRTERVYNQVDLRPAEIIETNARHLLNNKMIFVQRRNL